MPAEQPIKKVEFLDFHKPVLPDGLYEITVIQRATATQKTDGKAVAQEFQCHQTFSICGERYALDPQEVVAVFPPDGSNGDHSNVLPHVILRRSTLPWERKATEGKDEHAPSAEWPWLALLLFDESEAPQPQVIGRKKLLIPLEVSSENPEGIIPLELGSEQPTDRITVIDVEATLMASIVPSGDEMRLLAHVRRAIEGDAYGEERAVVVGNRLGHRGNTSVVHLVSMEGRYSSDGTLDPAKNPHPDNTDPPPDTPSPVRLVSLKSWRYQCLDETSFEVARALDNLNGKDPNGNDKVSSDTLKALQSIADQHHSPFSSEASFIEAVNTALPKEGSAKLLEVDRQRVPRAAQHKVTFKGLLLDLDRDALRLPNDSIPSAARGAAEEFWRRGYVPLVHELRTGDTTGSWYHGPMTSGGDTSFYGNAQSLALPVGTADSLLRYMPEYGMFDVSYAAAWELGRLLTLENKRVSLALFNWKRANAQTNHQEEAEKELAHLPFHRLAMAKAAGRDEAGFAIVADWLYDLSLLKGLPFNYLVADERMLPQESLRYFRVDPLWVECLLDGAFSIGRVFVRHANHPKTFVSTGSDRDLQNTSQGPSRLAREAATNNQVPDVVTGILLRSAVVAGWPDLIVDGSNQEFKSLDPIPDDRKLRLLRFERLSKDVLLCLFAGEVITVDIHQKPEALHFGISDPEPTAPEGSVRSVDFKKRRDLNTGVEDPEAVAVPFRRQDLRVVSVSGLAQAIQDRVDKADTEPIHSSWFATEMIEGVEKVRFVNKPA